MGNRSSQSRIERAAARYGSARKFASERKALDVTWRLIVLVVGVSLVSLGVFFLLFPGPGWATIILGLVVLGSEYTWAKRALHPIQTTASRLAERARNREATNRSFAIVIVAIMILTTTLYSYLAAFGPTLEPIGNAIQSLIPG